MSITLKKLVPGEVAIVERVVATGALKRRIFDMGITPGCKITLRKVAPLGDPIELNLRGYELSIRKAEAETILVKKVTEGR